MLEKSRALVKALTTRDDASIKELIKAGITFNLDVGGLNIFKPINLLFFEGSLEDIEYGVNHGYISSSDLNENMEGLLWLLDNVPSVKESQDKRKFLETFEVDNFWTN